MSHLALKVSGDALQSADRDRLTFALTCIDPLAAAGGFTGAIASSPKNPRENVRLAIDHVRFGVLPLRDQTDVFRNVGVRRTSPLAVDDFMKIRGVAYVARFHCSR